MYHLTFTQFYVTPWLNIRVSNMQHFSYLVKAILEFMRRLYNYVLLHSETLQFICQKKLSTTCA